MYVIEYVWMVVALLLCCNCTDKLILPVLCSKSSMTPGSRYKNKISKLLNRMGCGDEAARLLNAL